MLIKLLKLIKVVKKMYDEKHLIEVLKRNLKSELKVIEFYLENAEKLNYKINKKKIDALIFESYNHASVITKELLLLKTKNSKKMDKQTKEKALSEEKALQEIYKYELKNTIDEDARKILERLIKEETAHEKIVKSMK